MDLRRLRAGEWIAATAGAVLMASLFFSWYEGGGTEVNAWQAFAVFDVLLLVAAGIGIAALLITASQDTAAVGIATQALAFLITAPIVVVTLIRVLNLPGAVEDTGAGRTVVAWIGLLAVTGVAGGLLVAMRDERISSPERPNDPTGLPIESQPEVETVSVSPRGAAS